MTVAKVLELSAESPESFDHAIRHGIEAAKKSVRNIQGAWVKDQEVVIRDGDVAGFRVLMKVTFELE